ncbi:MAG: hypothetical protein CMH73_04660 [Nitrospina sp.]|nr:hypothetical protein [Nitrospina sp.]
MITQYPISLRVVAFFLTFLISSCSTLFKPEKTFSKSGLTVTFRSINALENINNYRFIYPIILSEKQLLNHLLSLWHNNIVSPGKPKPVFSLDEGAKLAPLFRQALKQVESGKYLHFEFQSPKGLIEGKVFATAKKLHWEFIKINNKFYSNDPLRIRKPTWKLVRIPGQQYQKLQSGRSKKAIKNKLVVDLNIPYPKRRSKSNPPTKPLSNNINHSQRQESELKSKLDTLKNFLDEELIDKSEYEKKRKSLMDQYFKINE